MESYCELYKEMFNGFKKFEKKLDRDLTDEEFKAFGVAAEFCLKYHIMGVSRHCNVGFNLDYTIEQLMTGLMKMKYVGEYKRNLIISKSRLALYARETNGAREHVKYVIETIEEIEKETSEIIKNYDLLSSKEDGEQLTEEKEETIRYADM